MLGAEQDLWREQVPHSPPDPLVQTNPDWSHLPTCACRVGNGGASDHFYNLLCWHHINMYATGRPDGAIRNAQDLLKINKHEDALGSLMEFMGTKRFQQWSPSHEKAMLMLIGLSIQLRKNAKFALVQYRLIAQQHTASFERVIREYLRLALEQVDAVEREVVDAEQKLKEDILEQENKLLEDDEDVGFAPQEQLFFVSGVGGEDFDQRVRRRLLGPWLRYLWDMFRSILDVLKNNSKLDHLYHEVSLKALDYCLRFQRPTEFRRLCELLRSHLLNMEKYQGQQSYGIDLRISESVVSYISTRCSQLKAACDLEIWTEAMTIVSDIHHLMELKADTILLPHSLMKKFYQSLVRIFWASEHFLFHAYAQRQLFLACHAELESLIETRSSEVEINAVSSEMRNAASHVVLSFLLIPSDSDLGKKVLLPEQIEIAEILDSVLDLAGYPSRQDLLQRILSGFGPDEVLTRANPQLVDLLKEMERGKSPYNLRRCFYGVLEQLNDDAVFKCYIELIRKTYIKNLVQRLANTCDSIKRERLIWFSSGMASEAVEIAASELDFVVFDHQKDMIFFQNTRIQDGVLSSELSEFAKELRVVCTKLNATNSSSSLFDLVRPHLDVERQDVFARLEVIEKRKRHQEELKKQQLEEQKARELQARLLREEEEKKRRAREAERREREKLEKEEREKNLQVATEMIENFKKNNDSFTAASRVKLDELVQNLDTYDPESIMKIQDEIVAEEERIRKRKEKDQEKKLNYLVRALRLEEHSLLLDAYARQQQEDKEYFEAQFKKIREEHKAAFDLAAQERKRLLKIVDDKESFRANVFEQRQQDLEDARVKQDERIAEFKKKKYAILLFHLLTLSGKLNLKGSLGNVKRKREFVLRKKKDRNNLK